MILACKINKSRVELTNFASMKLLFATGNAGKLREAEEILGSGFEVVSPKDLGIYDEAVEDGASFEENSYIKAKFLWDKVMKLADCGIDGIIADDSGLEVDALDGAPGIFSARYAGEGHDFRENTKKLLSTLSQRDALASEDRTARFRCVVTYIRKDASYKQFHGTIEGRIADTESGCGGFGYDPVFIPTDDELVVLGCDAVHNYSGKTLAEIPEHLKNAISHRYKALASMLISF